MEQSGVQLPVGPPNYMSDLKPGIDHVGISTAFICHDGNGRFLLHKRSQNCRDEQGTWEFGGGKLEYGLTLEENVLREIEEEYGCKAEIQEQLPTYTLMREAGGIKTHWIIVPYIVKVSSEDARIGEPHKMDDMGWFTLDDLPVPLHSGVAHEVKEFHHYIKKYSR